MANDIVAGLFGLSPYQVQQQQRAALDAQAMAMARMQPQGFEQAGYLMGKAGAGLGMLGAQAAGMVNPEVEAARQREVQLGGVAMASPEQLRQMAANTQDPRVKMQFMQLATQREEEAEAKKLRSLQIMKAERDLTAQQKLYGDIAPKDYTQESLAVFQRTRNPADLIPREKAPTDKQPTSVDEYKFAQSQGYTGTFQEWLKTKAQQIHVSTGIDSGESAIDPEVIDFYAKQQLLTGDQTWRVGLGRSKHGVALILAVDKRIPNLAKEVGMTPEEASTNKQEFAVRSKSMKDFATGTQGRMVNSFNTAIDHLGTLGELGDALKNRDTQAINLVANKVAQWTGSAAPTNLNAAKQIVGAEIIKAIVASGGGQAEREEAADQISMISSPEQLSQYIDTTQKLMAGQLKSLKLQYQTTTKRDDFDDKLTPKSKSILSGIDGAPNKQVRKKFNSKTGKWEER